MEYNKIKNKPNWSNPGLYPSGSSKQLGLNQSDLTNLSLGSWYINRDTKTFSLTHGVEYSENNLDNIVLSVTPDLFDEPLHGIVFATGSTQDYDNVTKDNLPENSIVPLYYDFRDPKYMKSSFPLKVYFGLDFPTADVINYQQDDLGAPPEDYIGWLNETYDVSEVDDYIVSVEDGGLSENFSFSDGTLPTIPQNEDGATGWSLRNGSQKTSGLGGLMRIRYHMDSNSAEYEEDGWNMDDGSWSYEVVRRPHVQLVIEFISDSGALQNRNIDIKIMDEIKFGQHEYWYRVLDLRGHNSENGIHTIYLDKIYPGEGTWIGETTNTGPDAQTNTPRNESNPAVDFPPFDSLYNRDHWDNGGYNGYDAGVLLPNNVSADVIKNYVDRAAGPGLAGTFPQGTPEDKWPGQWDMYMRNEEGWNAQIEPINQFILDGLNHSGFIKRRRRHNHILFMNPDTDYQRFPNPTRTIGNIQPPFDYINQYHFSNNSTQPITYWSGENEPGGVDSNNTPIWTQNSNPWVTYGDNDVWYTEYVDDAEYINTTIDAPRGFEPDYQHTRTDATTHHHGAGHNSRDGVHTMDLNTVKLPLAGFENDRIFLRIKNDIDMNIFGKNTFATFPTQGYYRIIFKNVSIENLYGNDSFYSHVKVSLTPKAYQFGDAGEVNISVGDDGWKTYDFEDTSTSELFQNNVDLKSNIFQITQESTSGTVNLDVALRVNVEKLYKNSSSTHSDSKIEVSFTGIEYEQIDIDGLVLSDNTIDGTKPLYKYKVLQWGDEETQLDDAGLLSTFFFKWYESGTPNLWDVKRYVKEWDESKYIKNEGNLNLTSHVYNTPGVKTIKTIAFRTNQFKTDIFESKLITTNVVVNDSNLVSQDFSIFGGTDFNFLPIKDNQAIIGGIDKNSKYNLSVSSIVKDDDFTKKDYLERVSSKDYIEKFNNKLLGEHLGQVDLGISRVFKGSKDIYHFITSENTDIVQNNFELPDGEVTKLPKNSLATDIFINETDCIVDFIPEELEYLTLPNKAGFKDTGVLIGDFKVNQPKGGEVNREGVMSTPILENKNDKQAF